jgi:potassium-dependent mechanosensitive channel
LEVRQVRVETAGINVLTLKVMSRLLLIERTAWEGRFRIANPGTDETVPDIKAVQKDLESLQSWMSYLRSRMEGVENHIRSQQALISSPDLSERDRGTARVILAAYQEQKDLLLRLEEQASGTRQLIQRLAGEISARSGQDRRVASSMKNLLDSALSLAGKIWFFDLYVAEETVIVDGHKIVTTRSVTVGKVIAALLIFFIGIMVAGKIMGPVRRLAARKFNLNENDAQVFGRVTYYLIFICILVFSLVTVNIPLAVFAFFGGALAIGIGFGAQTLISNFISGLILLFDRTIRLNDVVEVDGQRGRVTSIDIRSSRIKRFDGIEMLIPNSHFLQQNVVNLTLSDRFTRYDVAVGVAYGSATRIVEEVIMRAVVEQPEVQSEPPPFVVFEEFADSALNFRAFFWLELEPSINGNIVRSDIRHRIAEYLARAGIEIPFPQRDVHLDAARPLDVRVLPP